MKFFHLSDLHIGLKLYNRDLAEDQACIFDQIAAAAASEQPDAILIAGDIYDKSSPSADAMALFDRFIMKLTAAAPRAEIMCVSGNHDSATRVNIYRDLLSRQHVRMIGLPPENPGDHIERVTLEDVHGPVDFFLLPFVKPSTVRAVVGDTDAAMGYDECLRRLIAQEAIDANRRNVLVSHQFYIPANGDADSVERMDSEIPTVGNVDAVRADVLDAFDYAALGHIHKPMRVGCDTARYCGTPLQYSLSERGQQKGIVVVEMREKGRVDIRTLPLHPLRQVRLIRGSLDEVLAQGCDDYVVVALTDTVDLDILDMRDRLNAAFPKLLEIQRETLRGADYSMDYTPEAELDPFALCSAFLSDLDAEEQALIQEVINAVQEVNPA